MFQQLLFPLANLIWMDVVFLCDFRDLLFAFHGIKRNSEFKILAAVCSSLCHLVPFDMLQSNHRHVQFLGSVSNLDRLPFKLKKEIHIHVC
jgi:hypothetical protein